MKSSRDQYAKNIRLLYEKHQKINHFDGNINNNSQLLFKHPDGKNSSQGMTGTGISHYHNQSLHPYQTNYNSSNQKTLKSQSTLMGNEQDEELVIRNFKRVFQNKQNQ